MRRNPTELSYRRAAVQNATAAGLVIILYDMLIEDLYAAIEAIQQGNIERRAVELKHGFLVLQQLEGSLDMGKGGDAATVLSRFYSAIRAGMLEGHYRSSASILQRQIDLLLEVREAWVQANGQSSPASAKAETAGNQKAEPAAASAEPSGAGWSA